jgi:hypothetical protein
LVWLLRRPSPLPTPLDTPRARACGRHLLAVDSVRPTFCRTTKDIPAPLAIKRLLSGWEKDDFKTATPKAYLMEEDVALFCKEVIWYAMQVGGAARADTRARVCCVGVRARRCVRLCEGVCVCVCVCGCVCV